MPSTKLILASASPRRKEILETMGITFDIVPANGEETATGSPIETVCALAKQKAMEIAVQFPHRFIVGADTIVCIDNQILGKPKDAQDAYRMMQLLSGRRHEVLTAIALYSPRCRECTVEYESTAVYFDVLEEAEIKAYIATQEPYDKAGGYALQGRAGAMVNRIEGCASNVIGMPMSRLKKILRKANAIPTSGELAWDY